MHAPAVMPHVCKEQERKGSLRMRRQKGSRMFDWKLGQGHQPLLSESQWQTDLHDFLCANLAPVNTPPSAQLIVYFLTPWVGSYSKTLFQRLLMLKSHILNCKGCGRWCWVSHNSSGFSGRMALQAGPSEGSPQDRTSAQPFFSSTRRHTGSCS